MLNAREDVQPTGFFLLSAMQGGFSRASISVVALAQEQCRCWIIVNDVVELHLPLLVLALRQCSSVTEQALAGQLHPLAPHA